MVAPAYSARRSALAKQFGLGTAPRTVEQPAPELPDLPVEAEVTVPSVPVEPDAQYTATSVFANFPGGDVLDQPPHAANDAERPGRKRFAQQLMREGRRRV